MKNKNYLLNEEHKELIIHNVGDYLMQISNFRDNIEMNEGEVADTQRFFFRGQSNIEWEVVPSVFRENYLQSEAILIKEACLREPSEFGAIVTDFEKLAKLQHYGLPTRLLDVTSNPLVALYFACQEYKKPKSQEDSTLFETDGSVLYKRSYGKIYNDIEIKIVSYLANREMGGGLTLCELLDELVEKNIYSADAAKACREKNYQSLIEILQNNYFVMSNMNNERLIRQSGLFLLVGRYNINYQAEDVGKSLVQLAQSSAKTDFEDTIFRIPCEYKKAILKELDFYNINEGSLFPELEHQMSYVKHFQSNRLSFETGTFTKVDLSAKDNVVEQVEIILSDQEIEQIIDMVLKKHINPILYDDCRVAIIDNLAIDWYRRNVILSKIRLALTEVMCKYNMHRVDAKRIANSIVNEILKKVNKKAEQ